MPSTSPAQAKFMRIAAHSPEFAKRNDISQAVAREFNAADQSRSRTQAYVRALRKPRTPTR